jgi:hypothetical protein
VPQVWNPNRHGSFSTSCHPASRMTQPRCLRCRAKIDLRWPVRLTRLLALRFEAKEKRIPSREYIRWPLRYCISRGCIGQSLEKPPWIRNAGLEKRFCLALNCDEIILLDNGLAMAKPNLRAQDGTLPSPFWIIESFRSTALLRFDGSVPATWPIFSALESESIPIRRNIKLLATRRVCFAASASYNVQRVGEA